MSQPGDGEAIGRAVQSTFISCGSGGATVLLLYKFIVNGTWSLTQIINGCLAGLKFPPNPANVVKNPFFLNEGMVSVCSGCNVYHPLAAGLMGVLAGGLYLAVSKLMVKLRIDDPVDAVAVHCGSGFLSIMLVPFFR